MAPVSRSRLDRLIEKALTLDRPPIAGDWVRIGAQDDRQSLEPEGLTFRSIWFPYLPASGVARVIGGNPDRLNVEFWLRPMCVTRREGVYRPLSPLARWLERERIALWLMERTIATSDPPTDDPARPPAPWHPGPFKRRAARVRGGLRIVQALGGRWPNWFEFPLWLTGRRLARALFAYPEIATGGVQGVLIDRCTAILRFTYYGKPRVFRLDQVRRHRNENIHLLGRLLPSGEPRIFKLGMDVIDIEDFGTVSTDELWVELQALGTNAARHHRVWADWCRQRAFTAPPEPVWVDRAVEQVRTFVEHLILLFGTLKHRIMKLASRWSLAVRRSLWWRKPKLSLTILWWRLVWMLREWWRVPRPNHDLRSKSARWRGFILGLADRIETGEPVDPQLLLGLDKLRNDSVFVRRLLRAMLSRELAHLSVDDPRRNWVMRTLAISPEGAELYPWQECAAADALCRELQNVLPAGATRWNRILCNGRDPLLLLVHSVVCALFSRNHFIDVDDNFRDPQRPLKTPFLAALFLGLAEWNGTSWILTVKSAPKLRWLAKFGCEERWQRRMRPLLLRLWLAKR